jgi:hypothetical protein
MSFLAANPADFSYLSPCPVVSPNKSLSTRNYGGELRPSYGGHAGLNRAAIAVNFRSQGADEKLCSGVCLALCIPSFARSQLRGLSGARRHSVFCFAFAPLWGLGSSQNKFENHGKVRPSNFFRAPPRKQTFGTWEPGPLAKLCPM